MHTPLLLLLLLLLLLRAASADSARRTPPMGWNTWCTNSTCGHDVCTEDEIKGVAQSMLDSGLAALGWTYIDVSQCPHARARGRSERFLALRPTDHPRPSAD